MLDNVYSNFPEGLPGSSLPPRQSRSQVKRSEENRWDKQYELLRGHAWFHGRLPRVEAEKRITENGSFLVRASNSMNGFVVTTRWNGRHSHVVILPTSEQSNEKFHFDANYSFINVHELILFYKDSQMPISSDSGAILFTPISTQSCAEKEKMGGARYRQRSRGNSANRNKTLGKTKGRLKKFGSEPLLIVESEANRPRRCSNASDTGTSGNGVSTAGVKSADTTSSPRYPPRANSLSSMMVPNMESGAATNRRGSVDSYSLKTQKSEMRPTEYQNGISGGGARNMKSGSDSHLLESVVLHKPQRPLPRHSAEVNPNRRPNVLIRNPTQFYYDDGGDYTDYAQVRAVSSSQRQISMQSSGDYITMEDARSDTGNQSIVSQTSRCNSSFNSRSSFQSDTSVYVTTTAPVNPRVSNLGPSRNSFIDTYGALPMPSPDPLIDAQMWNIWLTTGPLMTVAPDTDHLPAFTKPLDAAVWTTILRLLADTDEDTLAGYIANESCRLLHRYPATCKIPSLDNGFQLILIPRAECYREHLINRTYCLSRFVAASILMCKPHERNYIVKKWISVAESLVMIYRDYYSLHAVNEGIFCNQVRLVVNAVTMLPQPSNLATTVGREIRISHRRGDECCVSPHIDICVPDVAHFIHVYSASYDDLMGETPDSLWELTTAARAWAHVDRTTSTPRRLWVAEMQLDTSVPILEELFTTEIQMKLLWGTRGYSLPVGDRQLKLEAILHAFAKKAMLVQSN